MVIINPMIWRAIGCYRLGYAKMISDSVIKTVDLEGVIKIQLGEHYTNN
jgi:hypothetical protein